MTDSTVQKLLAYSEDRVEASVIELAACQSEGKDKYAISNAIKELVHAIDHKRGIELREYQFVIQRQLWEQDVEKGKLDIEIRRAQLSFEHYKANVGPVSMAMNLGQGFAREFWKLIRNKG